MFKTNFKKTSNATWTFIIKYALHAFLTHTKLKKLKQYVFFKIQLKWKLIHYTSALGLLTDLSA